MLVNPDIAYQIAQERMKDAQRAAEQERLAQLASGATPIGRWRAPLVWTAGIGLAIGLLLSWLS